MTGDAIVMRGRTCRTGGLTLHQGITLQPYSNGVWYDVGNMDGAFVVNWVEGAIGSRAR